MKNKIILFLNAEPDGQLEFSLDADQDDLERVFSHIYKTPEGRAFVGKILLAAQMAYFDNERGS